MVRTIGVIGNGHYGKLLRKLIRRFALDVNVLVHDKNILPDGHAFVVLEDLRGCDAVIFAVPMEHFEGAVRDLLSVPNLRGDMVLVNVCSDQTKSGETLRNLAGSHPIICAHSPWGPEAYRLVNEVVTMLPAIVLTGATIEESAYNALFEFVRGCGFKVVTGSPEDHDRILAGRQMYVTHLVSQILGIMGILEGDYSTAPLSFQDLARSALAVRNDRGLFLDLWARVPECDRTFGSFLEAVRLLETMRAEHVSPK